MSDSSQRQWRFFIDDMIGSAEKVLAFSEGFDQDDFVATSLNYDAVLRNLELIGEAAKQIPEDIRLAHPEIPWRMIIATPNRLIHGYMGIDNDVLWSIIRDDVPELLPQLQNLKNKR